MFLQQSLVHTGKTTKDCLDFLTSLSNSTPTFFSGHLGEGNSVRTSYQQEPLQNNLLPEACCGVLTYCNTKSGERKAMGDMKNGTHKVQHFGKKCCETQCTVPVQAVKGEGYETDMPHFFITKYQTLRWKMFLWVTYRTHAHHLFSVTVNRCYNVLVLIVHVGGGGSTMYCLSLPS